MFKQFITCLSSGGLTLDMKKDVLIKKRALGEIGTEAGAIAADVQLRHVMLGTDPVLSYSLLSKVSADLFDFARGRTHRELEDELTSWKCTVDMMSSVPPDPSSATIADIRVNCRSITRMTITQNGLLLYGLTNDCICAGERDPSQPCDRPVCDYRATLKTFRVPYDTEVKEYGRGGKTRTKCCFIPRYLALLLEDTATLRSICLQASGLGQSLGSSTLARVLPQFFSLFDDLFPRVGNQSYKIIKMWESLAVVYLINRPAGLGMALIET